MSTNANTVQLGERLETPPGVFLILDFESTCSDDGSLPRNESEIIEIGAVAVDGQTLEPIGEFQAFIKPKLHPKLTDFCKELTSITQEDVDTAEEFEEVANSLFRFAFLHGVEWWGSWGKYDFNKLNEDVALNNYHSHPLPWEHFNVKEAFSDRQKLKRRLGLSGALKLAGLTFDGTAHRGIDDAKNIVRLLPYIVGDEVLASRNFSQDAVEEGVTRKA